MRTFALLLCFCSVALAEWTLSSTVLGYVRIIGNDHHLITRMLETAREEGDAARILQLAESAAMSRGLLETANALLNQMPVNGEEVLLPHLRDLAAASDSLIGRLQGH